MKQISLQRLSGSLAFSALLGFAASAAAQAADPPPPPAETKWYEPVANPVKVETPTSSVRLGVLLQPQFESVGSPALDGMSNNLFLRRTRLIFGATLFTDVEVFFDTEFANLFRAGAADGVKATPGMNVQDAMLTYKALGDQLKIDAGYMLPPSSHNGLQSSATMLGWDYYANSFRHSNVFGSSADPIGRDAGVELRGLVLNNMLDYRVGMFQGLRRAPTMTDVGSTNMFRFAGRLQVNLLDAETGLFYGGTYFGAKSILSFGAFFDVQDEYKHFGADGLLDLPLGPGVLTAQVNVVQYDGGDWVALAKQTAIMAEAGYTIAALQLAPVLRLEQRAVTDEDAATPDETRIGGGLSFFAHGHNFNLKLFVMHIDPEPAAHAYNALNLQAQVYLF